MVKPSSISSSVIVGFLLLRLATTPSSSYSDNQTDFEALLAFKKAINQDPFGALISWNETTHFCRWNGVFCSKKHRNRVVSVSLRDQGLVGALSPHIANLSFLREIYLNNNSFGGQIPEEMGGLTRLESIDFGHNYFGGGIPESLVQLRRLEVVLLGWNNLGGSIPWGLYNLSSIKVIQFYSNQLHGTIPSHIVLTLPQLVIFDLGENHFTGSLPASLSNSSRINGLYLDSNNFAGIIHSSIGNLSDMELLILNHNKLTGEIPSSICNMKSLKALSLSYNSLDGSLPQCLGNFSRSLQFLHLRENRFQGIIPTNFAKGCGLASLLLSGNKLKGQLPQSLINCENLQVVDVKNNRIQSKFPFWMEALPQLRVLILRSNMFNGSLLSTPGTNHPFSKLQVFDVSLNAFTGSLPTRYLKNFRAMMHAKDNRSNQLIWLPYYKESLTLTLKGLEQSLERMLTTFTTIDLSSNRFSGSIPDSIGNLNSLIYLNLSHNCITGHIPASLGNMSALESLDLSSNQLVGNIPAQLTKLTFLSRLNLSMNNLSGQIPQSDGQFSTFENCSYSGNLALCGFPLTQKCGDDNEQPSIPIPQQERDGSDFLHGFCWQAVTLGYGCGFILGVIVGYVIFINGKPKWLVEFFFVSQHKINRRRRGNVVHLRT